MPGDLGAPFSEAALGWMVAEDLDVAMFGLVLLRKEYFGLQRKSRGRLMFGSSSFRSCFGKDGCQGFVSKCR